jgi:hypothetical protein
MLHSNRSRWSRARLTATAGAVAIATTTAVLALAGGEARTTSAGACPAGLSLQREPDGAAQCTLAVDTTFEHLLKQGEFEAKATAPFATANPSAFSAAIAQSKQLAKSPPKVRGIAGTWTRIGKGPLIADSPAYGTVNGLGLAELAARIDDFAYDADHNRLFAAAGTAGLWMSNDGGSSWTSIGDSMPSQIVSSVAWTPANLGTVIALSGDSSTGSGGYPGFGAFWSTDLGTTWHKATGIPDGALGWNVAVDGSNPSVVYAATLLGLYRSTDGGQTWTNVNLPVGEVAPGVDCTGVVGGKCALANVVTDVAVRAPGGVNADVPAGSVTAIVGWRASDRKNADGTIQSPGNGVYVSPTGAPGTFTKAGLSGWPSAHRQGRVELGPATGPLQDHDYLYAVVQDAATMNGELDALDVPVPDPRPNGTNLNGIYVSPDFGKTWVLMADDDAIAKNPATGSSLAIVANYYQLGGYEPGIQAWYDEFITPDPTRQVNGIPTRLAFGLEEVWQNEVSSEPLTGPTTFKVIGRYFSGRSCQLLDLGLPTCPTDRQPSATTTTHPDQQAGVWIPDGTGGVTLGVGNDGGFFRNHVAAGVELDNGGWGRGNQNGFDTILPYDVAIANDGTVVAGLQDNGQMKIEPTGVKFETKGGDGFFTEIDPGHSEIQYEEYTGGGMFVSTDSGKTWTSIAPKLTNARFANPFEMDATDPNHLVTAGREVVETTWGPQTQAGTATAAPAAGTTSSPWVKVFDLGTAAHPGDASAVASTTDPALGMSAIDTLGNATYVGFCGACHIINAVVPFKRGIATNVGGSAPAARLSADGWHIASANGLPNRFITSVTIDPADPKTVYVTLGGYSIRWVPPGSLQDTNPSVGQGPVFVSHDAGENFTDISGNLPDAPAVSLLLRGPQVIVGTDVGVFATGDTGGTTYAPLPGLPNGVPIAMLNAKADNPNLIVAATYGRGIWAYSFARALDGSKATGGTGIVSTAPTAPTNVPLAGPWGFELGADGWTATSSSRIVEPNTGVDQPSPTPLESWQRSAPGHAPSTTSFQVFPYADESEATLTSPTIDSGAAGWIYVKFWRKQNTEACCDPMAVEYSFDNGLNWYSAPWVWDGSTSQWRSDLIYSGKNRSYPSFDSEMAAIKSPGGALKVRFRMVSDQLVSAPVYEGVWVDDVSVTR